jgi:hypothetical protein
MRRDSIKSLALNAILPARTLAAEVLVSRGPSFIEADDGSLSGNPNKQSVSLYEKLTLILVVAERALISTSELRAILDDRDLLKAVSETGFEKSR